MEKAIKSYYKRLRWHRDYYKYENFSKISKDIKKSFKNGIRPVKRTGQTDLNLFKQEFGYELPKEIADYINLYWHTWISGFCDNCYECVILFSVLKNEGDDDNAVLYYKTGLIDLARSWSEIGDINKYVPIGWLNYSGSNVLYELNTKKIYIEDPDSDVDDGSVSKEPLANSLTELIHKLRIKNMKFNILYFCKWKKFNRK